ADSGLSPFRNVRRRAHSKRLIRQGTKPARMSLSFSTSGKNASAHLMVLPDAAAWERALG
ncbi:MAG: hypothetical protein ACI4WX_02275, partial [Aristaeellaceae bacterium]